MGPPNCRGVQVYLTEGTGEVHHQSVLDEHCDATFDPIQTRERPDSARVSVSEPLIADGPRQVMLTAGTPHVEIDVMVMPPGHGVFASSGHAYEPLPFMRLSPGPGPGISFSSRGQVGLNGTQEVGYIPLAQWSQLRRFPAGTKLLFSGAEVLPPQFHRLDAVRLREVGSFSFSNAPFRCPGGSGPELIRLTTPAGAYPLIDSLFARAQDRLLTLASESPTQVYPLRLAQLTTGVVMAELPSVDAAGWFVFAGDASGIASATAEIEAVPNGYVFRVDRPSSPITEIDLEGSRCAVDAYNVFHYERIHATL